MIDDAGVFHLFFDVAQYSLPRVWRQVALGHAISLDGLAFAETETNLLTVGGGSFKLWFAGTGRRSEVTSTGIGLATPNR